MTDGTAALGRTLVDTFGRGWSKLRVDLIASVFSPEAVFIETVHGQGYKFRSS